MAKIENDLEWSSLRADMRTLFLKGTFVCVTRDF
jgi:hypothetical protein